MQELRVELDSRMAIVIKGFEGKSINQEFITSVWATTMDEIKNFNDEKMFFSGPLVEFIHSYYFNTAIRIQTSVGKLTIGELTTQDNPPTLQNVPLVELYKVKQMFENTLLEKDIVAEITSRLNDGSTEKQTSRSDKWTSN